MDKNDYEIIDNFLEINDFNRIKDILMGQYFPWYFNDFVLDEEDKKIKQYQLVHNFYNDYTQTSNYLEVLEPIISKIKPLELLRIKANLNPIAENQIEHGYHVDYENSLSNQKTAVFYINTNNGYTLFEDGTKVESVENRFVSFKTSINHTGSTCTNENRRVLINFNYTV
jgi:alpha-galactosidase/6-phospho-beta-glucosidase family protein